MQLRYVFVLLRPAALIVTNCCFFFSHQLHVPLLLASRVRFQPETDQVDRQATKKRVLVLNAIHQKLHHNTLRCIPALEGTEFEKEVEIYHRFTYQGQDLDVCTFFAPGRDSKGYKEAFLLVKYTSDDLSDDTECVVTSATWCKEAQADKFSKKHEELSKHYWTPRWKVRTFTMSNSLRPRVLAAPRSRTNYYQYVVNILRNEMAHRYEKNGTYIPEPKSELDSDEEGAQVSSSSEIIEEPMEVFAGCTGKLIGPKGSKINELKKASGCKDIKMPEKDESADRPKARSPVSITLIGTARQIAKARKLVQEVVDEWVCLSFLLSRVY